MGIIVTNKQSLLGLKSLTASMKSLQLVSNQKNLPRIIPVTTAPIYTFPINPIICITIFQELVI